MGGQKWVRSTLTKLVKNDQSTRIGRATHFGDNQTVLGEGYPGCGIFARRPTVCNSAWLHIRYDAALTGECLTCQWLSYYIGPHYPSLWRQVLPIIFETFYKLKAKIVGKRPNCVSKLLTGSYTRRVWSTTTIKWYGRQLARYSLPLLFGRVELIVSLVFYSTWESTRNKMWSTRIILLPVTWCNWPMRNILTLVMKSRSGTCSRQLCAHYVKLPHLV